MHCRIDADLLLLMYGLQRRVHRKDDLHVLVIRGAICGYLSTIVAAGVSECATRGFICLQMDFTANLYFFPTLSMGWVYGAILFPVIGCASTPRVPSDA